MASLEELEGRLNELIALKKELKKSGVGAGESFLRGGVQSATLGFADEAEAGVRALFDPEKEYKDYIGGVREEYDVAQEANPIASGAGSVVGAFIPGMGQAAVLGKAARGAGALAKAANYLQKTKTGAGIIGATEGAAAGYGLSKDGDLKDVVMGGVLGGALGAGGKAIANKLAPSVDDAAEIAIKTGDDIAPEGTALKMAKDAEAALGKRELRKDATEIASAWKALTNEDPPPMALEKNREIQRGWAELLESTTRAGGKERAVVDKAYRGIEAVADEIDSAGGRMTSEAAGLRLKSQLQDLVKAKFKPLEESYEQLEGVFDNVPISKGAIKGFLTKLSKDDLALDPKVRNMINEVGLELGRIKDVSGLRKYRTIFSGRYNWSDLTDNERRAAQKIYQTISNVRNNSISREASALKGTKFLNPGHLKKLLQTDLEYSRAVKDVGDLLQIDPKKGISVKRLVKEYLSDKTPLENYFTDLFEKGDIARLKRLQLQYPKIFETMRQRYLSSAVEKATSKTTNLATPKGIISKAVDQRPEVSDLMLGDLTQKTRQAQSVASAIPGEFNPSRSGVKVMEYGSILNPAKWPGEAARQLQGEAKRAMLRGKSAGKVSNIIASAVNSPQKLIAKISMRPGGQKYGSILQQALDRGDASYASTYFLMSHTDEGFRRALDEGE